MKLVYELDHGDCNTSSFEKVRSKPSTRPQTIKVIYQLSKEVLESADLEGEIKYKRFWKENGSRVRGNTGDWVIIDSLKTPVEINRTFPLSKLESIEFKFPALK